MDKWKKFTAWMVIILLLAGFGLMAWKKERLRQDGGITASVPEMEREKPGYARIAGVGEGGGPEENAFDFTVEDMEGNSVSLSQMYGRPLVLGFWAAGSSDSLKELPEFDEVYGEWKDEVRFAMVHVTEGEEETLEAAEQLIREKGYTFPVYFDTGQEAAYNYGVSELPVTFFLDSEGKQVARWKGWMNAKALKSKLEKLTEEAVKK